jgi:germination protein M
LRKKIWLLTAAVLILTLILAGCSGTKSGEQEQEPQNVPTITDESDELIRETIIYYEDDAGYLVPVMRKIPWVEGIAKYTLRVMMDTPEQQEDLMMMGLRPLLPADTEILGMSIKDGIAKLDLNEAVLNCRNALEESNMIQGIVLTLADFSTIDKVQFLFNGKILDSMPHGTVVKEPIGPSDINLEMAEDTAVHGAKVTVFFQSTSSSMYDYLIPVTRITSSENASLETAISELLKGPVDTDNMTIDIPPDTKLLGIQMDEGITYINFSKEFNSISSSDHSEDMVLKAIKLVAMQYPEVEDVEILVEGKTYAGAARLDNIPVFANEW